MGEIMTWWPGWDSVASTGYWSHFWFWFGIICLFALGASEIVSHVYGLRKDELVAIAERAASDQRKAYDAAAEERRKSETEALQRQLTDADKKVAGLQAQNIPRHLSEADKATLIAGLSAFPGRKVDLFCVTGAWDAAEFAKDLQFVFKQAKWIVPDRPSYGIVMGADVAGVEFLVNPSVAPEGEVTITPFLQPIVVLSGVLQPLGQRPANTVLRDEMVAADTIQLRIGRNPPK